MRIGRDIVPYVVLMNGRLLLFFDLAYRIEREWNVPDLSEPRGKGHYRSPPALLPHLEREDHSKNINLRYLHNLEREKRLDRTSLT